jgi:hypothetical protein
MDNDLCVRTAGEPCSTSRTRTLDAGGLRPGVNTYCRTYRAARAVPGCPGDLSGSGRSRDLFELFQQSEHIELKPVFRDAAVGHADTDHQFGGSAFPPGPTPVIVSPASATILRAFKRSFRPSYPHLER